MNTFQTAYKVFKVSSSSFIKQSDEHMNVSIII